MEKLILGHITLGMLLSFALGVLCLIIFMWVKNNEVKQGYSNKRFLKPTTPNILFHIVSSLLVLLVLHEISEVLLEQFLPQFKPGEVYHMTLSGLTGMFGSVLVGFLLEKWAKKRNDRDNNINHIRGDDSNVE